MTPLQSPSSYISMLVRLRSSCAHLCGFSATVVRCGAFPLVIVHKLTHKMTPSPHPTWPLVALLLPLSLSLQARGLHVVPLLSDGNLVDVAWGAERPGLPDAPLRVHELQWAGRSIQDKLNEVCVCVRGGEIWQPFGPDVSLANTCIVSA